MNDFSIDKTRRILLLSTLATGVSACSINGLGLFGISGMPSGKVRTEPMTLVFLPMVNKLRASHGLSPLSYSRVCEKAAIDQASRMALVGKMNHITGHESVPARFKRIGLPLPAAENIAMYQKSPERAFQAWVNSHKHLENMLGSYSHLGAAEAQSPNSENRPFWSMSLSQ